MALCRHRRSRPINWSGQWMLRRPVSVDCASAGQSVDYWTGARIVVSRGPLNEPDDQTALQFYEDTYLVAADLGVSGRLSEGPKHQLTAMTAQSRRRRLTERVHYSNGDIIVLSIDADRETPVWYRVSPSCPDARHAGNVFFGLWRPLPRGACAQRVPDAVNDGRDMGRRFRLYLQAQRGVIASRPPDGDVGAMSAPCRNHDGNDDDDEFCAWHDHVEKPWTCDIDSRHGLRMLSNGAIYDAMPLASWLDTLVCHGLPPCDPATLEPVAPFVVPTYAWMARLPPSWVSEALSRAFVCMWTRIADGADLLAALNLPHVALSLVRIEALRSWRRDAAAACVCAHDAEATLHLHRGDISRRCDDAYRVNMVDRYQAASVCDTDVPPPNRAEAALTVSMTASRFDRVTWTGRVFIKCVFAGAAWTDCRFVDCRFVRCNFVDAVVDRCIFDRCAFYVAHED
ncbi:Pentapeptide domain containing protein [Pandoravirus salinus]|uniref:Pentapeptide domain containing protein n=1 Tax=Pandoravirus salinus TaxID=1349410 RepID=S4VYI2_9VIRU|nr:Pentapeptide superfamily domain [Pandoravirus salinus]AGO85759.1 Pentapeptide domain containing protein [Pandoravirus salinus]